MGDSTLLNVPQPAALDIPAAPANSIAAEPPSLDVPAETAAEQPCRVCIEFREETLLNVPDIQPYLEMGGNWEQGLCFLAIRFKNPVVIPSHIGNNAICISKQHCIAVDVKHPINMSSTDGGLVFYLYDLHNRKKNLEYELLLSLFPRQAFKCQAFYGRTLYVVSDYNPFGTVWTRMRKSVALSALKQIYDSCVAQSQLFTFEVAALMRYFFRNKQENMFKFCNWYTLARTMCHQHFQVNFEQEPTTEFGKKIFSIGKRSVMHVLPSNHPPREFYTCQITLNDTVPVGIACCIVGDKVHYVSVMIVAYTKEWYSDTTGVKCCFADESPRPAKCRFWYPLLKDMETWQNWGFASYMKKPIAKLIHLRAILNWLALQTAEPYRHMQADLTQVYHLLTGIKDPSQQRRKSIDMMRGKPPGIAKIVEEI